MLGRAGGLVQKGRRAAGGQLIHATYGLLKPHMAKQEQCLGRRQGVGSELWLVFRIQGAGDCPRCLQVWSRQWLHPSMGLTVTPSQSSSALSVAFGTFPSVDHKGWKICVP